MTDEPHLPPRPPGALPVDFGTACASLNAVIQAIISGAGSPADLAGAARWVHRTFGLRGVAGVQVRAGTLRRLRAWDAGTPGNVPLGAADLAVLRRGEPDVRAGGLLLPLRGRYRARFGLWLDAPGHPWAAEYEALLRQLALVMGVELERGQAHRHLHTLQTLHRDLLGDAHSQAYALLLRHAIATIPGAETGSLAVSDGELFRFVAAQTHDDQELTDIAFRVEDSRDRWYGAGEDAWNRGVPRLARGEDLIARDTRYVEGGRLIEAHLASLDTIQANIAVPILYAGEVTALLNIDSLTDADAFSNDSLDLAASFGVQASLILHEFRLREEVRAAARTDELTGLPNRRAFSEALRRQLDLAHREGTPLTMLLLDVHQFKGINDHFGHAAGDDALIRLGQLLSRPLEAAGRIWQPAFPGPATPATRGAAPRSAGPGRDAHRPYLAFRWGGDEFALLLPGGTEADGEALKRGIQERIGAAQGTPALLLDVGVATLEALDRSGALLLRTADTRMYDDKRRHAGPPDG